MGDPNIVFLNLPASSEVQIQVVGGVVVPADVLVSTDGVTATGDGTYLDPVTAIGGEIAVVADDITIGGDGTTGDPIHVLPLGLTDQVPVLTDSITCVGNGTTALPITVITGGGGGAVVADGVTLTGFGTVAVPLTIKQVEHDGTLTGAGTVASPLAVITPYTKVTYTATGGETDFSVPIGVTLAAATYFPQGSCSGVTFIVGLDLPNGGGDRTTTHFRCVTTGPLTAGDVLEFIVFP